MVDTEPRLGLPLMHHLVEHGVLDLGPWMTNQVPPADGDLQWPPRPDVYRHLAQPGTHPGRKPDGNLPQRSAEMSLVQAAVQSLQPVKMGDICGQGTRWPRSRWRMGFDREPQEFALGGAAQQARNSRVQESNDGAQHAVRCMRVAAVNSQNPAMKAEHDGAVRVRDDSFEVLNPESVQSLRKMVLDRQEPPRLYHNP